MTKFNESLGTLDVVLRRPLTPTSDRYSKLTMREGDVVDVSYMLWNKQDDKDD